MTVLDKIAYYQNRRDEVPNQELAKELAAVMNKDGIKEIAGNLWHEDKNVQSDCIKVLYEIGFLAPELISEYANDFLRLLKSRNNRMIWGAMIALSTIASLRAKDIYENIDIIYTTMKSGSLITVDNGVRILATLASLKKEYTEKIFPFLLNHLKTFKPMKFPHHAEIISIAVNKENKKSFLEVLNQRQDILTPSQINRMKRLYKEIDKIKD